MSRLVVLFRRIEFVSCGPPVRIRLLSTPPHSDAVTFSYGALANPGSDFHRTKWAPSRAHSSRPERSGEPGSRRRRRQRADSSRKRQRWVGGPGSSPGWQSGELGEWLM